MGFPEVVPGHELSVAVAEIVQLYGRSTEGDTSKVFDNADFGYTRVTVERPLRLRYRMSVEDKARFLDACPHLLCPHAPQPRRQAP